MIKHTVSETLRSLHAYGRKLPAFQQAGIGMWAVKAGRADVGKPTTVPYDNERFAQIAAAVMNFLLKDPVGEEGIPSSTLEVMLRLASSQFTFAHGRGSFGRAYLLWHELPPTLTDSVKAKFDFESKFLEAHRTAAVPFLMVSIVTWAAANAGNAFSMGYMLKAVQQGLIPDIDMARTALNVIAGDPTELAELAEKWKCPDRRFAAYDFNSFLVKPILRPWGTSPDVDSEGLIAAVPSLIEYRVTNGVYYALFNAFRLDFSNYFGLLFEAYVGRVIAALPGIDLIFSEDDLLPQAPKSRPTVDWVFRIGDVGIILECKATTFNRVAQTTGAEEAIEYSLKQVAKGVRQCNDFIDDLQTKRRVHPELETCVRFIPIIVTWETMPLINSVPMRKGFLPGIDQNAGVVLSVEDLEQVQALTSKGVNVLAILDRIQVDGYYKAFSDLHDSYPTAYGEDSFLYEYDQKLFNLIDAGHHG